MCNYYIAKKKRNCKYKAIKDEKYCKRHKVFESEESSSEEENKDSPPGGASFESKKKKEPKESKEEKKIRCKGIIQSGRTCSRYSLSNNNGYCRSHSLGTDLRNKEKIERKKQRANIRQKRQDEWKHYYENIRKPCLEPNCNHFSFTGSGYCFLHQFQHYDYSNHSKGSSNDNKDNNDNKFPGSFNPFSFSNTSNKFEDPKLNSKFNYITQIEKNNINEALKLYEYSSIGKILLTKRDVEKKYHKLALIHHPDKKGGDTEKFKLILKYKDILIKFIS